MSNTPVPVPYKNDSYPFTTWSSQQLANFVGKIVSAVTSFVGVAITGSTVDSSVIGGTTAAAGHFTSLASTSGALNGSLGATTPSTVVATTSTSTTLITATHTPASSSAAGVAGTIAWDTGFVYICSATNTWLRVAIATW